MASAENFAPSVLKRLAKEMQDMQREPPEGIKVTVNDDDITDIQAVIAGPAQTPYAGGSFRVKLTLSDDFPTAPPKGYFLTKIFHPNVAKNGEICVSTLKRDWKKEYGVQHILLTIKCLLIVPNPESALNEEAGKLLLERYEDYFKHAQLMTSIHAIKPSDETAAPDGDSAADDAGAAPANGADTGSAPESDALAKKRAADKKDDKRAADKKRGLKRL